MNSVKRVLTDLSYQRVLIAPSILAANFAKLGEDVCAVADAGADMIHIDVMDGHFVPNISIGTPVMESIKGICSLPYDVHLMISNPRDYIKSFVDAGADHITIHLEVAGDVREIIDQIHSFGCSAGLSIKPRTSFEDLLPYLDCLDLVLVMSVEPGFGGQSFMPEVLPKLENLKLAISNLNRRVHLQIDGGINKDTAKMAVVAGANILVAGTSVFRDLNGMSNAIATLKGEK